MQCGRYISRTSQSSSVCCRLASLTMTMEDLFRSIRAWGLCLLQPKQMRISPLPRCVFATNSGQAVWTGDCGMGCFRDYASRSWQQHASVGNLEGAGLLELINKLFATRRPHWGIWRA
ncbi:hypothetical protein BDV12DRAFT_56845 [Aspergillus spectabilis]